MVVGHSLGAGTAALLAMLLQEDIQKAREQQKGQLIEWGASDASDPLEALAALSLSSDPNAAKPAAVVASPQQPQKKGSVLCWAFACPPVVSQNLATQCSDLVRSVVLQVPALSSRHCNVLTGVHACSWAGGSSCARPLLDLEQRGLISCHVHVPSCSVVAYA